jgi:hypothetical protein
MIARLVRPALLLAATAALGACSSYGYGGSRVSVGYSSGGYYPYSYSRYPYYGWYDGFYYPGTGYYIFDSYGRRHRWSDRHRHYWEGRRGGHRDSRDNWGGYRRDRDGRYYDGDRRGDGRDWRRDGDGRDWRRDGDARDGRRDGDRREWRQGDGRRGERAAPPVARPRPERSTEPPRARPKEAREGRPSRSVDRGREFRRGSRD